MHVEQNHRFLGSGLLAALQLAEDKASRKRFANENDIAWRCRTLGRMLMATGSGGNAQRTGRTGGQDHARGGSHGPGARSGRCAASVRCGSVRIEVMQIGCHKDIARVPDAALASGVAVQGAIQRGAAGAVHFIPKQPPSQNRWSRTSGSAIWPWPLAGTGRLKLAARQPRAITTRRMMKPHDHRVRGLLFFWRPDEAASHDKSQASAWLVLCKPWLTGRAVDRHYCDRRWTANLLGMDVAQEAHSNQKGHAG